MLSVGNGRAYSIMDMNKSNIKNRVKLGYLRMEMLFNFVVKVFTHTNPPFPETGTSAITFIF